MYATTIKLTDEESAALDELRGGLTRRAMVRQLILRGLGAVPVREQTPDPRNSLSEMLQKTQELKPIPQSPTHFTRITDSPSLTAKEKKAKPVAWCGLKGEGRKK